MTRYQHCPDWDRDELTEDVDRIRELLCGAFLPEEGRYEHVDVLGVSPTSGDLLDRLREFCTSPDRRVDDYLVLYLTGHGEILDDGDHVLLTSDTRPSDLLHRTVPTSEIMKRVLAGTRVRRLLLLLDTCYSGRGGEDLVKEALRRLDWPTPAPGEDIGRPGSSGIAVVAATRPYQQALPGVFTTCLDRAARSVSTAGNAPATLGLSALMGALQTDLASGPQSAGWHQIGMDGEEPAFLLNPRHRPQLLDVDLLEQERAQHAEQRAAHLRDRFLPASRWFTGRRQALLDLAGWLADPHPDPRPRIVTGRAGSGKTAVLGLLVALSDPDQRPSVPLDGLPGQIRHLEDTIDEVIYAGTMTTAQVRDRIAAAAGTRADTAQELIDRVNARTGRPLVVLVDALDEAADPDELCRTVLLPLATRCAQSVRLLLGSRPHLLTSRLLGTPDQHVAIDLDSPAYADPASIRAHVRRILLSEDTLDSYYQPSGIYRTAPAAVLEAVTTAIGEAAGTSFLVARITATTESTATTLPNPADAAWKQSLPRLAGDAMRRDLQLRLGPEAQRAAQLLLPLAYAQGTGLPWEDIWPRVADALSPGHDYGNDDLIWLRRAAGSYAVESVEDGRSVYRLYHRALAEHLRHGRDRAVDQHLFAATLLARVPPGADGTRDWPSAHPYIRAHLATHAGAAGKIDPLLEDPAYLLTAGRPQLLAALDAASSPPGKRNADAYRRAAPRLRSRPASEHISYLQLAARCARAPYLAEDLNRYLPPESWSTRWASWRVTTPHHTITGHTYRVRAVAVAELDGRPVVVSGADDRTVRVWDLATGAPVGDPFTGHTNGVNAVAVAELDGRPVVVSAADDRTVRVWDLATGAPVGDPFTGHTNGVNAVAVAELDGRPVVVSAADDRTVRVWDLATGTPVGDPFTGHTYGVRAVAVAELDGRPVVVSGAADRTVRVWDLATGAPVGDPFTGHTGPVRAVAVAVLDGRPVVVSAAADRTVRVWDLTTGAPVGDPFTGHTYGVRAVAVAELDGRPVVVSAADDARCGCGT